jgi:hypothetical protein
MRESRTYGSVRGALSNERPYRVIDSLQPCALFVAAHESDCGTSRKCKRGLLMSAFGGQTGNIGLDQSITGHMQR